MALIVQKYGGSSVGSAERIQNVARRIEARATAGDRVVAVVSAMGDKTDELIELAQPALPAAPGARDGRAALDRRDRLLGAAVDGARTGSARQRSASRAFRPAFAPTPPTAARASPASIPPRLERELAKGHIVIVAGFQGCTEDFDVTTLGREAATRRRWRSRSRCTPTPARSTPTWPGCLHRRSAGLPHARQLK